MPDPISFQAVGAAIGKVGRARGEKMPIAVVPRLTIAALPGFAGVLVFASRK